MHNNPSCILQTIAACFYNYTDAEDKLQEYHGLAEGVPISFFLFFMPRALRMLDFSNLTSPILLRGDERTAYRDPAVYYHDGLFISFSR